MLSHLRNFLLPCLLAVMSVAAEAAPMDGQVSPFWSYREAATTSTRCVRAGAAVGVINKCALFLAGQPPLIQPNANRGREGLIVQGSAISRICFTLNSSVTIGSGMVITDAGGPNGTTEGSCLSLSDPAVVHRVKLDYDRLLKSGGARTGICSTAVVNAQTQIVYPPCGVSGDCTALSAGTCTAAANTSLRQRQHVGAYALTIAASTSNVDVTKTEYVDPSLP